MSHDRDTMLLWLSAAFVADFENHRDKLHAVAADESGLLWFIRDRMGEEDQLGEGLQERFSRFSNDQLVFIVEAFGVSWPTGRDAHRRHRGQSQSRGTHANSSNGRSTQFRAAPRPTQPKLCVG